MSGERRFQPRRSFIFAPGIRPDMFPKALASGTDIVCIDLEDAIAPQHKAEAREKTLALFQEPQADDGVELSPAPERVVPLREVAQVARGHRVGRGARPLLPEPVMGFFEQAQA